MCHHVTQCQVMFSCLGLPLKMALGHLICRHSCEHSITNEVTIWMDWYYLIRAELLSICLSTNVLNTLFL